MNTDLERIVWGLNMLVEQASKRNPTAIEGTVKALLENLPYEPSQRQEMYDEFTRVYNSSLEQAKPVSYTTEIDGMQGILREWDSWLDQLKEAIETDYYIRSYYTGGGYDPICIIKPQRIDEGHKVVNNFRIKVAELEVKMNEGILNDRDFDEVRKEFSNPQYLDEENQKSILESICRYTGLYITLNQDKLEKLAASLQEIVRKTYPLKNITISIPPIPINEKQISAYLRCHEDDRKNLGKILAAGFVVRDNDNDLEIWQGGFNSGSCPFYRL